MKKNNFIKPNIFDFATKELSQDAFIAWLLSWAEPVYAETNKDLHECSKKLIEKLCSERINEINKIKVTLQFKNIDILVEINDSILLLIEDKTTSEEHNSQLIRYVDLLKNEKKFENHKKDYVYFKTGNESRKRLRKVESQNFKTFLRADFLDVLNGFIIKNDIYNDFKDHLLYIEEETTILGNKAIEDCNEMNIQGFFQALERKYEDIIDWGFAAKGNIWYIILKWVNIDNKTAIYLELDADLKNKKLTLLYKVNNSDNKTTVEDLTKYCNVLKLIKTGIEPKTNPKPAKYSVIASIHLSGSLISIVENINSRFDEFDKFVEIIRNEG